MSRNLHEQTLIALVGLVLFLSALSTNHDSVFSFLLCLAHYVKKKSGLIIALRNIFKLFKISKDMHQVKMYQSSLLWCNYY